MPDDGFVKQLNDGEIGQVLALVSNVGGVVGVAGGVVDLLRTMYNLDEPAITLDQINDAIQKLQNTIDNGLSNIGSLINKQANRIVQNLNMTANQEAIAHARTALDELHRYIRDRNAAYLVSANQDSSLAAAFLEQRTDPAFGDPFDPFYIGALSSVGTARIAVILAQAIADHVPYFLDDVCINEINQLSNALATMLNTVRNAVHTEHTIVYEEYPYVPRPGVPPIPQLGRGRISHAYRGQILTSYDYAVASHGQRAAAESKARHDYDTGISNELGFLQVPQFESVLLKWQNVTGVNLSDPLLSGATLSGAIIVNRNSGKVLDVPLPDGTNNDVVIQQFSYNGGTNQRWQLTIQKDNPLLNIIISSEMSKKCLNVVGGSLDVHAQIQQHDCDGGASQRWIFELADISGRYYFIRNANSRLYLDIPDLSKDDHAQLQQYLLNRGINQQWKLVVP